MGRMTQWTGGARRWGGRKKEGNEDFSKASGKYNRPTANEVDFEGRSSNGKLESRCEESKRSLCVAAKVPAISDRGRSLRILSSAAGICTVARNDAEQVFTGADLQLNCPGSTTSLIHPFITNFPGFPSQPWSNIAFKSAGLEAQKATVLSILGLREYKRGRISNKCALNRTTPPAEQERRTDPFNQGPHSITMLNLFGHRSEHQEFRGMA